MNVSKFARLFTILIQVSAAYILFMMIYHSLSKNTLDFSCSSNLLHRDLSTGLSMNTNEHFMFRPDGKGMITLDGEIYSKDHSYKLSRTIQFNYEHFGKHIYKLSGKTVNVNNKDSLPENMFEDNYYSSSEVYISHIKNIKNAFLIGSRILPVSVCITN